MELEKQGVDKARKKIYFFFLIALLIFIVNGFFKLMALQKKCFIFCLSIAKNSGAAFSLFEHFSFIQLLLIVISLVVLFLTVYFYVKHSSSSKLVLWALPLIFAGTFCNLLDRIMYGYVIDYIPFFSRSLFIFNIADLANFIGVVLLITYLVRKKKD